MLRSKKMMVRLRGNLILKDMSIIVLPQNKRKRHIYNVTQGFCYCNGRFFTYLENTSWGGLKLGS